MYLLKERKIFLSLFSPKTCADVLPTGFQHFSFRQYRNQTCSTEHLQINLKSITKFTHFNGDFK